MAADRHIPTGRKLLFALATVGTLSVFGLWGYGRLCERFVRGLPPAEPTYPSLAAFLGDAKNKVKDVRHLHGEAGRPGAADDEVMLRVPRGTAGASEDPRNHGFFVTLPPERLPGPRRVLLLGSSAAFGYGLDFKHSLGAQLAGRLREGLGEGAPLVLNLARPGWELNSVALLARRMLELQPRPEAIVLYSGNNELFTPVLFGLRAAVEDHPVLRVSRHWLLRAGLLRPPQGFDPGFYKNPDWHVLPDWIMAMRIFHPRRGVVDASHWPKIRDIYTDNYGRRLAELAALYRARGVPLVLVPPPVNLHFFPAGVRPQPVSHRPVGALGYARLADRLESALRRHDRAALERLAGEEPGGPIQRFWLAQQLDEAGRHAEAEEHYLAARDAQMGVLGALPTLARKARALRGPGVAVAEATSFYPRTRSLRKRSKELFLDACHLSAVGNELLAREVARELLPMLRR